MDYNHGYVNTMSIKYLLNVLDVIKDATKGKVVGIISHVEVLKEEIEDSKIVFTTLPEDKAYDV